jgi:hypothetical protein
MIRRLPLLSQSKAGPGPCHGLTGGGARCGKSLAKPLTLLAPTLALAALLGAAPASASTLAQAMQQWTGLTPEVAGKGAVTITMPPQSPVHAFTARAQQTTQNSDSGWRLRDIKIPHPIHLPDGDDLTLHGQNAMLWLGGRTVSARGKYSEVTLAHQNGAVTHVEHVAVALEGAGGPVSVSVDLGAMHLEHAGAGVAKLLPRRFVLQGHTSPAGAAAIAQMLSGDTGAPAPVTIDNLSIDLGPAHFEGSGTVTLVGPRNREGTITLTAQHFKELLQAIPMDGPAAQTYPALMMMRQLGHASGNQLVWTIAFKGQHVMIGSIDIGPLMGM